MNALTLTQPWASLMAWREKKVETRSWAPPAWAVEQPLAIHAGKGLDPVGGRAGLYRLLEREPFATLVRERCSTLDPAEELPRGKLVAVGWLKRARPTEQAAALIREHADHFGHHELALGDYGPARWAWLVHPIVPLPQPIPARGSHKVWQLSDTAYSELLRWAMDLPELKRMLQRIRHD